MGFSNQGRKMKRAYLDFYILPHITRSKKRIGPVVAQSITDRGGGGSSRDSRAAVASKRGERKQICELNYERERKLGS